MSYTKQNFKEGDILTAAQLNNIEDGLVNLRVTVGQKPDVAIGEGATSEGDNTVASGDYSHAEGGYSVTTASFSHAEGFNTIAASEYQHVEGIHNIKDENNIYAHIVGNGTSSSERSNAHTLDWNGNAWFAGNVYVGGTSQDDATPVATTTETWTFTLEDGSIVTKAVYVG